MPERHQVPTSARAFEQLLQNWRTALRIVPEEATFARDLLDGDLQDADSEDDYERARARIAEVSDIGSQAMAEIEAMLQRVGELRAEWRAARRYEPSVLDRRVRDLAAKVAERGIAGAQEWLHELFDALDALEWAAVEGLAEADIRWPDPLAPGARRMRDALRQWQAGNHTSGRQLMCDLAADQLEGWHEVLGPMARSRAHRLAAWVSLRRLRDPAEAEKHLTEAIDLFPYAGRMHAERAAYYLSIGDLDRAAMDAQHAIELAADDAAGYMELGIWAELHGDFEDADELYKRALKLFPTFELARLHSRAVLMDPPGRLLIVAAELLLAAKRPAEAAQVAARALTADLRGTELHPQAAAHRVRSEALGRLGPEHVHDAATAAAEAGKLYLWNGDLETAIGQLERALRLDGQAEEVGWLLADARIARSLPLGQTTPDQALVHAARSEWDRWAREVGPPRADTSWAYLTRAIIADLATQEPRSDRLSGIWEALLFVEKALVHDDVDAQRWGYAAQYLRYVNLKALAFEAAERGYRLGAEDRQVLAERLPVLANRGRLAEAEEVGEQLVAMFGNDPWISAARAWLALHSDRGTRHEEAMSLLELPLAEGNDPSWYYELRSVCHVAMGDVEAARDDMNGLIRDSPPIDGTTKCRLAAAAAVLGAREQAQRWLQEAEADPTSRALTCLTAKALIRAVDGELEGAAGALEEAAAEAESVVDLADIVELTRTRLALVDWRDATSRERVAQILDEFEKAVVPDRARCLEALEPDPDQELADALAKHGQSEAMPGLIRTALLAVQGRRHLHEGRFRAAVDTYESLIGSGFEPEATLGLTNALRALASELAHAGKASLVRQLYDRLNALSEVSPAETAIAVASAYERGGAWAAACDELERALPAARDEGERQELHQRAGGLALADDDLERAGDHFTMALESARECRDGARIGQSEIRLALLALLERDQPGAAAHLLAAVRAWRQAGALEPGSVLMGELRGLVDRPRGGGWRIAAVEAKRLVELVLNPDVDSSALDPSFALLRRELDVVPLPTA